MGRDKQERKLVYFLPETQLPALLFGNKIAIYVGAVLGFLPHQFSSLCFLSSPHLLFLLILLTIKML